MVYLKKWPVAGFYGKFTDVHDICCVVTPATWAWCHYIQKTCVFCVDGFFGFTMQIFKIRCHCCLCNISNVMVSNDACQVFAVLHFTYGLLANRRCRCICIHRCCRRTLDTGVHIGTIVIADINHVMSTLHRTGQGLETDVVSSAVSTKCNKFKCFVFRQSAAFFQGTVSSLNTTQCGTCIFKCIMYVTVLPCGVWIHKRRNFQTSGRITNDCVVSLMQSTKYGTYSDCCTTAGTHTMSRSQSLWFFHHSF